MGHHHHHDHSGGNLKIAFFLNLIFTIVELIGGLWTNSLAILSDAVHDLGDSLALGFAWYFEKVAERPLDEKFTYGYKRFSVLGAIINSVILIVGSIYITITAIPRLFEPDVTHSGGMIILAVGGVLFNGIAYWKTHTGHSHNERVVSLHLLEDVLGWVAVLVGAILMYFTNWYIIDPILSLLIALFILYNVFKNIKSTTNIILQGIPDGVKLNALAEKIMSVKNVVEVHDLHVWSMDGNQNILTAHIVVPAEMDLSEANSIKSEIHHIMIQSGINHCTLEIERVGDECNIEH